MTESPTVMTDAFGRGIKVGDRVVYAEHDYDFSYLAKGTVTQVRCVSYKLWVVTVALDGNTSDVNLDDYGDAPHLTNLMVIDGI